MKFKDIKHLPHDASGVKNPEDWQWVEREGKYFPQDKPMRVPSTKVKQLGKITMYKT
jgi:hypothetical protein